MTDLAALDQRIRDWEDRLRRIDENLLALEADATYQMLSGARGAPAVLEGITRERVHRALDAMTMLFDQREKIADVIVRAETIRASISTYTPWTTGEKVAELVAILDGPSIVMTGEAIPLAERRLLDVTKHEVALRPEELLPTMTNAFESARDAFIAVRDAWSKLDPVAAEVEQDVMHLERAAFATTSPELESVREALASARHALLADPLGVGGVLLRELRGRVAALKKTLDATASARARVADLLVNAASLQREVAVAHVRGHDASVEILRDFETVQNAPNDAVLGELETWHAKLDATARAGHVQRAEIGLERFLEIAKGHRDAALAIVARRDRIVGKRDELLGRLSARRAQLGALRARGVVSAELEERGRAALAVLTKRPCAIDRAASCVAAFEAEVVELSRR